MATTGRNQNASGSDPACLQCNSAFFLHVFRFGTGRGSYLTLILICVYNHVFLLSVASVSCPDNSVMHVGLAELSTGMWKCDSVRLSVACVSCLQQYSGRKRLSWEKKIGILYIAECL